ncbi:MAG: SusC/RagA family TonB-linked outer membrane protein [Longimicrobiales bacterium]|nr:SusC/RagA family TonB-linked outer membrane protein [Longimicrobiales bacterium]
MMRPLSERLTSGVVRGGLALALSLALGSASLAAQATGTLVGTVRDVASQRPLEAAQVYITGTGIGALSNAAGRFLLLNVPAGQVTLVAELVGYKSGTQTVTVAAGESVVANFGLDQTAILLDQIVVTGAGVATARKKLGNTIATVDARTLENKPISDFSQMIAGREPGVVSLPASGYTGEGAKIRIRGSASLSQQNDPVVYIDGIRMDGSAILTGNQGAASRLDDIPPESIERVEILKGAAAATLYGTEASSGVIQIFTKKGRAGAPRFTVQADYTAVSVPTNRIQAVADFPRTAADQTRIQERFGQTVGLYTPFEVNSIPEMLTTGWGKIVSASAQGGSESFQYFVSGRYTTEDGPYDAAQLFPVVEGFTPETDSNRRAAVTTNFTIIPSTRVRIGVSMLYSDMEHHTPDNANNIYGVFSSMLMSQLRLATPTNLYGQPAFATARENMYQQNVAYSNHFNGSVTVGFTPTQNLRVDGTFGADFSSDEEVYFRPYRWNVDNFSSSTPDGNRSLDEFRTKEITSDLKGSYVRQLGSFENTILFGGQGFLRQRSDAGGNGENFPGPGLETLSALAIQSTFENWLRVVQIGGYVQDQVDYNDWVFLTLGGRWDANSAFGSEFATAFYPKASISVVPSQGLGWSSDLLSTWRVRGAIGRSGRQPGAFDKFTTFAPQPSAEGPGVRASNLGNDALAPEVSTEFEVGTELGLWGDRASIDLTYWNRTVSDALVAKQFPVTGGFTNTQLANIGEMKAHGVEVNLKGTLIQREGISLNLFANTAYLSEEITDMGGAAPLKTGGSYPRYRNYLTQGFSPGSSFGAEVARHLRYPINIDGKCVEPTEAALLAFFAVPRDPSSFKPLALGNDLSNSMLGDPNGTLASHNCGKGLLESYLGKPTPDFAGSVGFNLAFAGNFELSSLFEYKVGNFTVHDLSGAFRQANAVIGRNTPQAARLNATLQNPASTAQARLEAANEWVREVESLSPMDGMNAHNDASFVQWRELSLSYRVPSDLVERWGLANATVNLGARNLRMFMLGDYRGMDPEGNVVGRCNGGLDCNFLDSTEGWGIPIPRRFTVSTRVTF